MLGNVLSWPLPTKNVSVVDEATAAAQSSCILSPHVELRVGDILNVTVIAKNARGQLKTYGGDFFQAKLFNSETKASLFGLVTDHYNGTYTVQLPLLWPGPARVAVRLVHSSEAVQVLARHRELQPNKVFFLGLFREQGTEEKVACNAQRSEWLLNGAACCCEFREPVSGEVWLCRKPPSLPCSAWVSHSFGGYQAQLSNLETKLLKRVKGRLGKWNDIGERLCEMCDTNELVIPRTLFPHKNIRKAMWVSLDGMTRNQMDHVLISKRFRNSVKDTRVYRSADIESDHYLVCTTVKLRLRKQPKEKKSIRVKCDTAKPKNEDILKTFIIVILWSWKRGLIIKLVMKGNLKECKNSRGITLLFVMGKILGRIIIDRIRGRADCRLRKEQAGYRKGRGTAEQVFILRNIIEQVSEWQAMLCLNFVEFEEAFDPIHRESQWVIMKEYRILEKIVRMVKIFYEDMKPLSKGKRKKCIPGLETQVPAGFYHQDQWTSLVCESQIFSSASQVSVCLRDKQILMMGDSTLRQWFEYLVQHVPSLKLLNLFTSAKSGPFEAVDTDSNIRLEWRAHGLPLRTSETPRADLHYIAAELQGVAGGEHTVVVFTIWAHFTTHPLSLYVRRLANIRRAVVALLQRAPRTLVVIKTANTGYKDVYGSDWLSWQLDCVLRVMFKSLPVVILDVWQMTSCHYSPDNIHPPPEVIRNEVDLFLSFVCPK
ncbi:NXPE family member 3-like [Chanos chanos]|uniref:NXPE family member 3-like n=1 Tax=Chanos chanos TaxID=29144 RepID=A0A6J2UML6_CHACN|nr:NXPE family member 3-like [Chanos chanos]